jgi:hypothetical protein
MIMKSILFALAFFSLALPAFGQGVDPLIGTWKLNLAKSKFDGPAPAALLTFEAVGQASKVTAESVDAQGNPTKIVLGPYLYDGRPYPASGSSAWDASSYKIINNSTAEIIRTKAGKVVLTETRVLSADGRTLTFTIVGRSDIQVYEKQ